MTGAILFWLLHANIRQDGGGHEAKGLWGDKNMFYTQWSVQVKMDRRCLTQSLNLICRDVITFYQRPLITYHPSSAAIEQTNEMTKDAISTTRRFLFQSSLLWAVYAENPRVKLS